MAYLVQKAVLHPEADASPAIPPLHIAIDGGLPAGGAAAKKAVIPSGNITLKALVSALVAAGIAEYEPDGPAGDAGGQEACAGESAGDAGGIWISQEGE